ncbi:phosphoglycerate mutase-like protein [Daedaleopsis nitida]|nr:phosphoglycerate mutase-like protein [Daedaleopsis nitida]
MSTVVARIYIVRHGETDDNRQGVIQGHLDTLLNAAGIEQAQLTADALEDVPFGAAYSSDLQRARKTAEIILEKHPGLPLQPTEALRERYLGDWQGRSYTNRGALPENIEPMIDFVSRAVKWWNEAILRHAQRRATVLSSSASASPASAQTARGTGLAATAAYDGNAGQDEEEGAAEPEFEPVHILVVSHGGLIGSLVTNLIGSRKVHQAEGVVISRCFNASISVVELYGDGRGVLVSYADTTHLDVDLVQENADVRG